MIDIINEIDERCKLISSLIGSCCVWKKRRKRMHICLIVFQKNSQILWMMFEWEEENFMKLKRQNHKT